MSPSNSIDGGQSYPSCLTLSLVVYYDRYFKDGLGGNTAAGSVARYSKISGMNIKTKTTRRYLCNSQCST